MDARMMRRAQRNEIVEVIIISVSVKMMYMNCLIITANFTPLWFMSETERRYIRNYSRSQAYKMDYFPISI